MVKGEKVLELTFRGILLAIILTVILAMSNAYLALKVGILTSASIPAAIISMGILSFFKNATILENNAVQTAASAGEAIAGGIVYTIPALLIIHYWHHFDYWTNFFIALCGGILGVLFSVPLRRVLVNEPTLKFPEGKAIAEVLKSRIAKEGLKDIVWGGFIGAILELLQLGFKVIANSWSYWFAINRSIFGFGAGFSATMIGAGYLIGYEMAASIFLGALISWLFALPIISNSYPHLLQLHAPQDAVNLLWNADLRYLGIGAMLLAGIWTFVKLIKPLHNSIKISLHAFMGKGSARSILPRTDKDIPMTYIIAGILFMAAILFLFFQFILPVEQIGLNRIFTPTLVFCSVLYILIFGFLFSVISAYFSGMVGVTASPGSSVVIAGILFAAWMLLIVINQALPLPLTNEQITAAEAITIIIGSVVQGIAAIANDNSQDLKVGQLVGATPWKQQVMLLIGVIVSALVIPPVMQLLFNVYGIAGVMPHENMDVSLSLPAPPAALLAAVTDAVFQHSMPWEMMFYGASIILIILLINKTFKIYNYMQLSILGVAIGMYLPLASSVPLFMGGLIAKYINGNKRKINIKEQVGMLIACGLVAGAAIMNVVLAIPFSIFRDPNILQIVGAGWYPYSVILAIATTLLLALWMRKRVNSASFNL